MRDWSSGSGALAGGVGQGGVGTIRQNPGQAPCQPPGADGDSGPVAGESARTDGCDGAGREAALCQDARRVDGAAEGERCAAGIRAAAGGAEHRAEGAADGTDDLGGGAFFSEDDHPAWDTDPGGGAHPGGCRGDLPDRTPVCGLAA